MNLPARTEVSASRLSEGEAADSASFHGATHQTRQTNARSAIAQPNQIVAARSQFLTTGTMPDGVSSPLVRSWQRSSQFGFASPALRLQRERLAETVLRSLKERNGDLIASAWDEMVSLGQELSDQGGVVILTDPDGIVLARQGDHAFSVEADRLGLSEGIDWSEQAIGTNAIGTTALERTALTIVGAEHLFCLNTSISCSAVPILDPCGVLAGVLDVSTSLSVPHDHLLLLLKRSVLEIERRLFEQRFPRHVKLRFHSSEHLLGGIRDGLLAFDDDRLVGANRAALELVGQDWSAVGSARFEELFTTDYDAVDRVAPSGRGNLQSADGREFFARLQLPPKTVSGVRLQGPAVTGAGEAGERALRPHLALEKMPDRESLRFRKMKARQLLYGANFVDDLGEAIVVFASGRYRCFASHEGRELTLFNLGAGDALPLGSDLTVEVSTDGDAAIIPRRLFQKLARKYPEFGSCVLSVIEGLLGRSLSMVGDMAFRSVRHRVIRYICELAERNGYQTPGVGMVIDSAPSGDELAMAIGAARQSVSTILAELIRSGEITRPFPRRLIVSDLERLRLELQRSS